jgi:hypothetical protein
MRSIFTPKRLANRLFPRKLAVQMGKRPAAMLLSGSILCTGGCTAYEPQLELWSEAGAFSEDAGIGTSSGSIESGPSSADDGYVPPAFEGSTSSPADADLSPPDAAPDNGAPNVADAGMDVGVVETVMKLDAAAGAKCSVSVTVTTSPTQFACFNPRNVGAIWIAQSSGAFVKTLAVWARTRIGTLELWGSKTQAAGTPRNSVDAITGATLSSHQTHNVTWNCTDVKRAPVPDGPYRVYFELTDSNSPGPNFYLDFTKGPEAVAIAASDQMSFHGVRVIFVP